MLVIWHLMKLFPRASPVIPLPDSVIFIYNLSQVTSTPYLQDSTAGILYLQNINQLGSYNFLVKTSTLPPITKVQQFSGFILQGSMMPSTFHHLFLKGVLMLMMLPCPAVRISLAIGFRGEGNSWFSSICFIVCPLLSNHFAKSQNGTFSLWHLASGSLPCHLIKHHVFL